MPCRLANIFACNSNKKKNSNNIPPRTGWNVSNFNAQSSQSKNKNSEINSPPLAHCLHPLAIHLELDGIWSWIWSWSRLYSPLGASHLAFAGDVAVVSVVAAAAALVVGNIRYEIKNTSLPTSKGRRGYSHSFQKSRCTVENAVLNINWALRQGYTFDIWNDDRSGCEAKSQVPLFSQCNRPGAKVQLKQLHLHSPMSDVHRPMSSASFQFSACGVASLADCMHVSLFFSPRAKWSKQTLITWPQVCASKRGLRIPSGGLGIADRMIGVLRGRGSREQTPQSSSSSFLMMTSNETLFIRFSCRYSQSSGFGQKAFPHNRLDFRLIKRMFVAAPPSAASFSGSISSSHRRSVLIFN